MQLSVVQCNVMQCSAVQCMGGIGREAGTRPWFGRMQPHHCIILRLTGEGDIDDVGTLEPFISLIGWSEPTRGVTIILLFEFWFEWWGFQVRCNVTTLRKKRFKKICRLPKFFGHLDFLLSCYRICSGAVIAFITVLALPATRQFINVCLYLSYKSDLMACKSDL